MSVRTMARVWAESKHTGTHLLMLLAIADFSDDDGRAYPSVGKLAEKCRMTGRNANHILAALRTSGELEVQANKGPRGCNRYRVRMPGEPLKPASPLKVASPLKDASPLKPASSTPEAVFPIPLKPTSAEPSLNYQEPPHARKRVCVDPRGFAEFWNAWPASTRKVDRKRCAEKWARGKLWEHLSEILPHVTAMKAGRQWREGFEPAPLTYLNGERWRDGLPPADSATTRRNDGGTDLQDMFRRGAA